MNEKISSLLNSEDFKRAKVESMKVMKRSFGYNSDEIACWQEGFNECAAIIEEMLRGGRRATPFRSLNNTTEAMSKEKPLELC